MIPVVFDDEVVGACCGSVEKAPHLAVLLIDVERRIDRSVDGEEPFATGVIGSGAGFLFREICAVAVALANIAGFGLRSAKLGVLLILGVAIGEYLHVAKVDVTG